MNPELQLVDPVVFERTPYTIKVLGLEPDTLVTVGARYSDMTWWWSGVTDEDGEVDIKALARDSGTVLHELYYEVFETEAPKANKAGVEVEQAPHSVVKKLKEATPLEILVRGIA